MDNIDSELRQLIEQGKKSDAIIWVKNKFNVSLKEADDYVSSLVFQNETQLKKVHRKSHIGKWLLIAIPIIILCIIFTGVYKANKYQEKRSKAINQWHKEVYGPKDYQEAYLKITNDSKLDNDKKSELYKKLRKQETEGVPFKETDYWKEYNLK